jgi:hypothetical protein
MAAVRYRPGPSLPPSSNPRNQAIVKLSFHSPSSNSRYPSFIPPLDFHQGRMAIDGHARREPPPLPSRAYISAPRASPRLPSPTPSSPTLLTVFQCAQSSSPSPLLKLDRRCRSPPPSTSPPFSLPPRLPRVVRKQPPPSFYFFPSHMPRRHSPAAGRPPPSASCRGRRPKHLCKHMFEFANSPATRRSFPRVISWPGVLFRPTPASAPPPLARALPPSRVRAWMAVGSAINGPDPIDLRVKPASNGQPVSFC